MQTGKVKYHTLLITVGGHSVLMCLNPCYHRCSSRDTDGTIGIGIFKPDSLISQLVDMWSMEARMSCHSKTIRPLLVCGNQYYIRSFIWRSHRVLPLSSLKNRCQVFLLSKDQFTGYFLHLIQGKSTLCSRIHHQCTV